MSFYRKNNDTYCLVSTVHHIRTYGSYFLKVSLQIPYGSQDSFMFLFITQNRKCLTMRSNQAKLDIIRIKNDKSISCPYRRYRQLNYHTQQIKKYCPDSHNLCFILIEHIYLFLFYYTVTKPIHIHTSTRLTFCLLRKKP